MWTGRRSRSRTGRAGRRTTRSSTPSSASARNGAAGRSATGRGVAGRGVAGRGSGRRGGSGTAYRTSASATSGCAIRPPRLVVVRGRSGVAHRWSSQSAMKVRKWCLVELNSNITAANSKNERGPFGFRQTALVAKCVRRRPTLPHSGPCSTIGAERLSFRVRDGTGRFPLAMVAETLWRYAVLTPPEGDA